jgi:hypothetical protein
VKTRGSAGSTAAGIVSFVLGVARGLMILGLALVMLVLGVVAVVPRFAPVPVEWEVSAAWLGIGTQMTIPVRFYVDADAHRIAAPSIGVERAELHDTHGSLRFPAPDGSFLYINAGFLATLFVLALWGLEQLHRVIGTLRKGQPFIDANARRLRRVAAAVIAGELIHASTVAFNQFYAKTHFTATGLLFDWSFNVDFFAIVLALIILAIAEVFAAGTRLSEDQALTI